MTGMQLELDRIAARIVCSMFFGVVPVCMLLGRRCGACMYAAGSSGRKCAFTGVGISKSVLSCVMDRSCAGFKHC